MVIRYINIEANNLKTVWGAHKSPGRSENDPRCVLKGSSLLIGKSLINNKKTKCHAFVFQDLHSALIRVAQFMDKPLDSEVIERIADQCVFKSMKKNDMSNYSKVPQGLFDESKSEFLRKGVILMTFFTFGLGCAIILLLNIVIVICIHLFHRCHW